MEVPVNMIASFELVDLPLIWYEAQTGKPLINSTGMAVLSEIDEATLTARKVSARKLCCSSVLAHIPLCLDK